MIDIETETLIDLREAAKHPLLRNPRTRKPCHFSRVYRYALHGAKAIDGRTVKLETAKTPQGLRTTSQAILRFIGDLSHRGAPPKVSTEQRAKQIRIARSRLEAAGI